jgi:hypothetical protein
MEHFLHTVAKIFRPRWKNLYQLNVPSIARQQCLVLASEARRPRNLLDTLYNVTLFQCADDRDKVYGILSIADWPVHSRPTVDYEKDLLELAIEVVGILFDMRRAKPIERPKNLDSWIRQVGRMFHLSPGHPSIDAAITNRAEVAVVPDALECLQEDRLLLADASKYGVEIYSSHIQDGNGVVLRCPIPKAKDKFVTLFSVLSGILAQATPDTLAGDWFLKMDNDRGLILRQSHSSRYTIIGLAIIQGYHPNTLSESQSAFCIYWDPEDALLYYLAICNMKDLERMLSVRICGSTGSSFAVRVEERY